MNIASIAARLKGAFGFVTAEQSVTGGIEFSVGDSRLSTGFQYRESKSEHVYGNAGIIDELFKSRNTRWRIFCIGDSRMNGNITPYFVKRAPSNVALAGLEMGSNTLPQAGFTVAHYLFGSGDVLPTSPAVGYSADGGLCGRELTLVSGTTPAMVNTLTNRLTYSSAGVAAFPVLPALFKEHGCMASLLVRKSSIGWSSIGGSNPNIYLQARPDTTTSTGAAGYVKSLALSLYAGGEPGYYTAHVAIPPGTDWTLPNFSNYSVEVVAEPSKAVTNPGKVASFSRPWVEAPVGGCVFYDFNCVPGSSIYRTLNDEMVPAEAFSRAIPSMGGNPAFFVAIGTNNPASMNSVNFSQALRQLVSKVRLADKNAPIIFTTNFASQSDGGTEPYYVQPLRDLAAVDRGVVVFDTYVTLPNYADGAVAGYYADTVHYATLGKEMYADMFWTLAFSA